MSEITLTIEQLYQQQIKSRPAAEQLRLVALISQQLALKSKIEFDVQPEPDYDETLAYYYDRLTTYRAEMKQFESHYQMSSQAFYEQFKQGQLADRSDFADWAELFVLEQDIEQKLTRAKTAQADPEFKEKRSLLELAGLGAEIWHGVDAQAYVDELRDEWDNR